MSDHVSDTKALDCAECVGLTTHYMYHDGNWYCEECGEQHE